MKTSKIKECNYTGDWKAPNGDVLYFHSLTLQNGDIGNVACAEKYASKIEVGKSVDYTITGNKIKLVQPEGATSTPETYNGNNSSRKPAYQKKKAAHDFLGYACSYAKDLVIAGKATAKDIKAYEAAAEKIYKHVQKLLSDD